MTDTIIITNIKYSSYFFRRDILDEFLSKLKATMNPAGATSNLLSNFNLYNADDILQTITSTARKTTQTRFMEENPSFRKTKVSNLKKIMNYLSKNICEDIDYGYTRGSIVKSMSLSKRDDFFDLLVISDNRIENTSIEFKERLNGVVGFIVVELGECKLYPSAYSIKLICTNKSAVAGTGSILMGAYLFTILSHPEIETPELGLDVPKGEANISIRETKRAKYSKKFETSESLIEIQHIAVLELSSGYMNPAGLCMYEKFGFKHDTSLIDEECFNSVETLPMIIDFNLMPGYSELSNGERKDKIIQMTCGNDKGFPKENLCSVKGVDQQILGLLKFLQYVEEQHGDIYTFDYSDPKVENLVESLKKYKGISILDLINYAEKPQLLRTRNIQNIFNDIKTDLELNEQTAGKNKAKKNRKRNKSKKHKIIKRKTRKNRK